MIYQEPPPLDRLEQGDLLDKTPELTELLATYHPYYAQHKDNRFFVVLTQSCDLVLRNGNCGARYISLAPVRPLRTVLKREFDDKLDNAGPGLQAFAPHRVKSSFEQFLHRLFNNNEAPFFYFEVAQERGVYEEMCAMLALPISLKPEHYPLLLRAKRAGITDVFQAKLGWLLGQMYSRVGTPDFDAAVLTQKVSAYVEGIAVWLEESDFKALRALVAAHASNPENPPAGATEIQAMLTKIPKRKNQVIDAVLGVAAKQGLVPEQGKQRFEFRKALEKDSALAALLAKG